MAAKSISGLFVLLSWTTLTRSLSPARPREGAPGLTFLLTFSTTEGFDIREILPRDFARVALNRGINQVGRAQNSEIQFRYGENSFVIASMLRYDVNSRVNFRSRKIGR